MDKCRDCNGWGYWEENDIEQTCPYCNGTGEVEHSEQCPDCGSIDLTLLPATAVHPAERFCNECGSGIPF
jgi:primosomal protein N'